MKLSYIILLGMLLATMYTLSVSPTNKYPRYDTNCPSKKLPGIFFNGQRCDFCANKYCYCETYLGCSSCVDGYSMTKLDVQGLQTEAEEQNAKCYSCNQGQAYSNYQGRVSSCCFHGVTTEFEEKIADLQSYHSLYTRIDSERKLIDYRTDATHHPLISRALTCSSPMNGHGASVRYGSYCLQHLGCIQYNDYGQCQECVEGYYLGQDSNSVYVCKTCPEHCASCDTNGQCNSCQHHYYLRTQVNRFVFDTNAATYSYASTCAACDTNCLCDGSVFQHENADVVNTCNLGCINERFIHHKAAGALKHTCTITCPDECETCKLVTSTGENPTQTVQCTKCLSDVEIDGRFYAPTLMSDNTCMKCPQNCYECEYNSAQAATSCKVDKCYNGYYRVERSSKSGIFRCSKCNTNDNNILRCNSPTQITQCRLLDNASFIDDQTMDYDKLYANTSTRSRLSNVYHLVGTGSQAKCVKNENSCRTISNIIIEGRENKSCDICQITDRKITEDGVSRCIPFDAAQMNKCAKFATDGTKTCVTCTNNKQSLQKADGTYTAAVNYVNDGTGNCKECNLGCLTCSNDQTCEGNKCQDGFHYLEQTAKCEKCYAAYCIECNSNACTKCAAGKTVWRKKTNNVDTVQSDFECVDCPDNCIECSAENKSINSDRRTCTQCANGYYEQEGTCYRARPHCAKYDQKGGKCQFCHYGFRVVDGICLDAIQIPSAYINVEYSCGTEHRYREDGDFLIRTELQDIYIPVSANIIQSVFVALISVLAFVL